jgi:thiol:disulfide interchange protein DsbD
MIFGASFLGAFEINLPSSWSNKIDSKAGIGSYSGIFFHGTHAR